MCGNVLRWTIGILIGLSAASAWGTVVTVDSTNVQFTLRGPDFNDPNNLQYTFAPGLGGAGTLGPLTNSGGTASADYSFTESAFSFSNLNFAIQGLSSANNTLAELSAYGIHFTANVDATWALSGSLTWSPGATQSAVSIYNQLSDVTDFASPVTLTVDNHSRDGVSNALTATVGTNLSGGINTIGATSGTLLAGHSYEWDVDYAVYTGGAGGGPSTGGFTLAFTPIPEPGAMSMAVILAAMGMLRRRR